MFELDTAAKYKTWWKLSTSIPTGYSAAPARCGRFKLLRPDRKISQCHLNEPRLHALERKIQLEHIHARFPEYAELPTLHMRHY